VESIVAANGSTARSHCVLNGLPWRGGSSPLNRNISRSHRQWEIGNGVTGSSPSLVLEPKFVNARVMSRVFRFEFSIAVELPISGNNSALAQITKYGHEHRFRFNVFVETETARL
jgi:hypothetical protein